MVFDKFQNKNPNPLFYIATDGHRAAWEGEREREYRTENGDLQSKLVNLLFLFPFITVQLLILALFLFCFAVSSVPGGG